MTRAPTFRKGYGTLQPKYPAASAAMKWAFFVVGVIVVLSVVIPLIGNYYTPRETITVVNSHERVCDSNGNNGVSCKYLVFTEAGTFRLQDSLVIGRFNSSDIYGRIKDGHRYRITSYGWRFGCTSSYPNIKNMEEVSA